MRPASPVSSSLRDRFDYIEFHERKQQQWLTARFRLFCFFFESEVRVAIMHPQQAVTYAYCSVFVLLFQQLEIFSGI